MKIRRYELNIATYQTLQPIWPGRILSVGPSLHDDNGCEYPYASDHSEPDGVYRGDLRKINMWAFDNDANRRGQLPPILGVWIIATGEEIPQAMFDADALFHGTVDLYPNTGYHVFTAVIGIAEANDPGLPAMDSVDAMAEAIAAKHRARHRPSTVREAVSYMNRGG